jgi:5-methylcytosine-specific restriction endonuclease McrA
VTKKVVEVGEADKDFAGEPFDDVPPTTAERGYGTSWRRLSRAIIRRHVQRHGWSCPGYGVASHFSRDLTVHHVVAYAEGGDGTSTNAMVLCRGCNAREAADRRRKRNEPVRGPADWWRDL